jgi:hypothetical protein
MAELSDDIAHYQQQVQNGTTDPFPYDRLMIYYRRQKAYKKELHLINQALKVFFDQLKQQAGKTLASVRSRSSIKRLSEQIGRRAGLIDKKGNAVYLPEPLSRWTKRKKTVEQKLKKIKQ